MMHAYMVLSRPVQLRFHPILRGRPVRRGSTRCADLLVPHRPFWIDLGPIT